MYKNKNINPELRINIMEDEIKEGNYNEATLRAAIMTMCHEFTEYEDKDYLLKQLKKVSMLLLNDMNKKGVKKESLFINEDTGEYMSLEEIVEDCFHKDADSIKIKTNTGEEYEYIKKMMENGETKWFRNN